MSAVSSIVAAQKVMQLDGCACFGCIELLEFIESGGEIERLAPLLDSQTSSASSGMRVHPAPRFFRLALRAESNQHAAREVARQKLKKWARSLIASRRTRSRSINTSLTIAVACSVWFRPFVAKQGFGDGAQLIVDQRRERFLPRRARPAPSAPAIA